jgi:hypothetical protein
MATPQSTASIREYPVDWVAWFLFTVFLAALGSEFLGWWAALAVVPIGGFGAYLVHLFHVRYPPLRLSEIGPIDMEIAECRPVGTFSRIWTRRSKLLTSGLFSFGFCIYAYSTLDSAQPGEISASIGKISLRCFELLAYLTFIWLSYKHSTWHLLIAGEGLFRLTDPTRPWLMSVDVREPNSPLRALRIYTWEQIERFHFTHCQNRFALHLSVRYPNMPVPQLISYDLGSLSDADRQRLEEMLGKHVPASATARQPVAV